MRPIHFFTPTGPMRAPLTCARIAGSCAVLMLVMLGGGLVRQHAAAADAVPNAQAVIAQCVADLAQRANCAADAVTIVKVEATIWPDAALGLPEDGFAYAQVLTPGWRILLQARGFTHLYTASPTTFRYGGPLHLWTGSMLYLQPTPNEPNLNGDLYQCALGGTNHVRVCSGVSEYYPQAGGVILVTRRTSRSSQELLYVNVGKGEAPRLLYRAFALGDAALNAAQDRWAALVRPRVGGNWTVVVSSIAPGAAQPQTLTLPDGLRPQRLAWSGDRLMMLAARDENTRCFEIDPTTKNPAWKSRAIFDFPGQRDYALNKSESLTVDQIDNATPPRVEIARVWFNGTRNLLATLSGLTLRGDSLVGAGYVLVWGEQDGKQAAYTINIVTGEVVTTFRGSCRDIKPFQYPPITSPFALTTDD